MVIITGASDGLGKELARILTEAGKDVVNISRTENQDVYLNIKCDLMDDTQISGESRRMDAG